MARLYVMEVVEQLDSRVQIELRMDPGQWNETQLASWRQLRLTRGIVWLDYLRGMGVAEPGPISREREHGTLDS